MPEVSINYLGGLIAAVASMIVAGVWFSVVFAKPWKKETGKSEEELKRGAKTGLITSFILALIMSYVLATVMDFVQIDSNMGAIQIAFWVWLGFVVTASGQDYVTALRSRKLFFINNLYQLLSLVVMALVIFRWS